RRAPSRCPSSPKRSRRARPSAPSDEDVPAGSRARPPRRWRLVGRRPAPGRDRSPEDAPAVSLPTAVDNLDGTRTELFDVECREETLLALLRDVFEEHWEHIVFGPCIEGAVFEGRLSRRPRVSVLDGYATVDVDEGSPWHFHLCIGVNRGSPTLPTP